MHFGINKHDLVRLQIYTLLFMISLTLVGCQTDQERFDAELTKCVNQGKEDIGGETICLEDLLQAYPDNLYLHYFLAGNYEQMKQLNKAEESIEIYIKYYPKEAKGYGQKCKILRLRAEYDLAVHACNYAIFLNPDEMSYRLNLASSYEDSGNFERAEFKYKQVLEIDPTDNSALLALGRLYEKQGRLREAIETYEKLLEVTDDKYKDKLRTQIEEAIAKRKIQQKTWKENIDKSNEKPYETNEN